MQALLIRAKKQLKNFLFAQKNKDLLKAYNLKLKKFSAQSFPDFVPTLWLDLPSAKAQIQEKMQKGLITKTEAELLEGFEKNGFLILKNAVSHELIDEANRALERAVKNGELEGVGFNKASLEQSRALDLHKKIPELRPLFEHEKICRTIGLIFDRKVVPFQSLNFFYGSQQKAHSDAIHMSTYPLGFMAASWTALEDIYEGSGELEYYPGSHKLPYVFSHNCGIDDEEYVLEGRNSYSDKYEQYIEGLIREKSLKPERFLPKKGDVLIWHHNLLHGGSPRTKLELSRKAFVCHYFAEGVVCYHDLINEQAKLLERAR